MTTWLSPATCVIALCILTFGLYLPRHHRGDLAAAYLVIGLGLGAIMLTLKQSTTLGAGFGLGILGVLSVFRLRSIEVAHRDVAYFFSALSIGIVSGLTANPQWLTPVLCVGILLAVFVGDHPRIIEANRYQTVLLDQAHTDDTKLRSELATLLNAHIHRVDVLKLDLLEQTTLVDVRFRPNRNRAGETVGDIAKDVTR
jgi:Domain of unknown function (DUF4956)